MKQTLFVYVCAAIFFFFFKQLVYFALKAAKSWQDWKNLYIKTWRAKNCFLHALRRCLGEGFLKDVHIAHGRDCASLVKYRVFVQYKGVFILTNSKQKFSLTAKQLKRHPEISWSPRQSNAWQCVVQSYYLNNTYFCKQWA